MMETEREVLMPSSAPRSRPHFPVLWKGGLELDGSGALPGKKGCGLQKLRPPQAFAHRPCFHIIPVQGFKGVGLLEIDTALGMGIAHSVGVTPTCSVENQLFSEHKAWEQREPTLWSIGFPTGP